MFIEFPEPRAARVFQLLLKWDPQPQVQVQEAAADWKEGTVARSSVLWYNYFPLTYITLAILSILREVCCRQQITAV